MGTDSISVLEHGGDDPQINHTIKRNKFVEAFRSMFIWYPKNYDPEERKLLFKLDLSILVFASVSYFAKSLDSANVRNAYNSGMREDLDMYANQLNWINIVYIMGYVVGQVPGVILLSRPKISKYVLPSLEILYGVITLVQCRIKNVQQLYALRFLIGLTEAPTFAGVHFILGKWYGGEPYRNNPAELFARSGAWFLSLSAGNMFSGYLQAAAYKNLQGVNGYKGWQWLFIIDGIITVPLAFLGFAVFPGIPESGKPWFLTDKQYELVHKRLKRFDLKKSSNFNLDAFIRTFKSWKFWLFVGNYTLQAIIWTPIYYFGLWLKAKGYTVSQINTYPTGQNAVGVVVSFVGTALGAVLPLWVLFGVGCSGMLIASIIMTVYDVPNGAVFFAFYISYFVLLTSPISFAYANIVLREDTEQKAIVLGSMMAVSQFVYVWLALALFPTTAKNPHRAQPEWNIGWPVCIGISVLTFVTFLLIVYLHEREKKNGTAFINDKTPDEAEYELSADEISVSEKLGEVNSTSIKDHAAIEVKTSHLS